MSTESVQWSKNCDMVMNATSNAKFSMKLLLQNNELSIDAKIVEMESIINSLAPTIADRLWYYPSPQN